MSIGLRAAISLTGVAPLELIEKLGPLERNQAVAQNVTLKVQSHLTQYNRDHPNQLGGKRVNFYRKLALSTNWQATEADGTVSISDYRASQAILGGPITPGKSTSWKTGQPTKALTVPASADSYGESAEKFSGQTIAITFKTPKGNLVGMIVDRAIQRLAPNKERREGAILRGSANLSDKGVFKFKRVLYWLLSRVVQKGRPDAIPNESEIIQSGVEGLRGLVQTTFRDSPKATAVIWHQDK